MEELMSKPMLFEEEMAGAAVDFLLENLRRYLLYDYNLILPVKDKVESLYNVLDSFKRFLWHSAKVRNKNEILREMMKSIRDVVYEVEDTVDEFLSEAALWRARIFMALIPLHLVDSLVNSRTVQKALHPVDSVAFTQTMEKQMKLIKKRLMDVLENNRQFGFDGLLDWEEITNTKPTYQVKAPIVEEENVVGFRYDAEEVIYLLTKGSEELEVISIVGMPGIGKTTFAKMIIRDPHVEYEFYIRIWVYISQEYNRKEVLLNILRQITKVDDDMYKMTDEMLAQSLSKFLESGKYLIVMDDVWTTRAWDDFKSAFPKSRRGSRILLTSQFQSIARYANPTREPYQLRFLTPGESWELFRCKALGSLECPKELMKHGIHIANKCKGLPLALVAIGGFLRQAGTETSTWEAVAESLDAYFDMDRQRIVSNFMETSFNHLPYHLKACFLYFAMFPENFEIPVWNLVRLWISEGFIQPKEEISLEKIAEDYLDDLINRNLVMVGKRRLNGKVKTCHVHDMLQVFCRNKAAEENFFREIKEVDQVTYSSSKPATKMYRRLCLHPHVLNYISSKSFGPCVRSFLCLSSEEITLQPKRASSILRAFKLLRVLDVKPIPLTRFPLYVTQLIHLRYVVLSIHFRTFPAVFFSSLWNLQTLIIETSSQTLEFKGDILGMIQLRHLKTNVSTSLPSHLAKSRKKRDDSQTNANLKTLSLISPESCTEDVFIGTRKLEKLGIRGRLAKLLATSMFDSLGKLDYLENLKLINDVYPVPPYELKRASLPQAFKFPPMLKKLTLAGTQLNWKYMNTLGKLENLEILKLKDNAFRGEQWQPEDGGFNALKVLHIGRTDLVSWDVSSNHFLQLRKLYLRHCSSLVQVPFGLADISSLQIIGLYCTTRSAAASAKNIYDHKMRDKADKQRLAFQLSIYPPEHAINDPDSSS